MPRLKYAAFGRGPDKTPRKKRFISALKTAGGIGAGAALSGVSLAGTMPTAGLLLNHQDSLLQKRLAISGLALGSGYGLYKGIKQAMAKAKQDKEKDNNNKHKYMTRFRGNGNFARFEDEEDLENYEVSEGEYNRELFEATIENIRAGVEAGVISLEEGEEAELNALDEYNALVAEELGYEIEDSDEYDEEYEEYSDGSNMAYFEAGNNFGNGLVELFDAIGYDDLSEGIVDLAEALGLDEEDTAGLLTGDYVPHPELIEQIAEAFGLDEETYAQLDYLGEEARVDAGYGEEEVIDEDIIEEAVENTAAYSRLENQLAEFQAEAILKNELDEFERDCHRGFTEGWLPPVVYRNLAGSFESEGDRLAAFSTLCASHNVDAKTQLFGFQSVIEAFRSCGPLMTFSSIVNEPLDPQEAQIEHISSSQAELNFQLRKQRSK